MKSGIWSLSCWVIIYMQVVTIARVHCWLPPFFIIVYINYSIIYIQWVQITTQLLNVSLSLPPHNRTLTIATPHITQPPIVLFYLPLPIFGDIVYGKQSVKFLCYVLTPHELSTSIMQIFSFGKTIMLPTLWLWMFYTRQFPTYVYV